MNDSIVNTIKLILATQGCRCASFTYRTKSTGELARYNVLMGTNYNSLVEKSLLELRLTIKEKKNSWCSTERIAAARIAKSLRKTLAAHKRGQQNADYTKKDQYIPIGSGLNINSVDGSLQLFGVLRSKVVLEAGQYKHVKSSILTVAQNTIRKSLPVSSFREFALDLGNIKGARLNGETIEIE